MSSLTSIMTIAICTSVLGIMLTFFSAVITFSSNEDQDRSIRIFIAQAAEDDLSLDIIRGELMKITGIDSIIFVSKQEAMNEFIRDFDSDMVELLPYNPLPPSFMVHPGRYYSSSAQQRLLRDKLRLIPGVEEISHVSVYLTWLDKWRLPALTLGLFCLLFIGLSLALIISNAVKLNLFTRRELVENMKYCGAGELYITVPFLIEGLILGAVGSIAGIVFTICSSLLLEVLIPGYEIGSLAGISLTVFIFTSLMGSWASFSTVRKFVNE